MGFSAPTWSMLRRSLGNCSVAAVALDVSGPLGDADDDPTWSLAWLLSAYANHVTLDGDSVFGCRRRVVDGFIEASAEE